MALTVAVAQSNPGYARANRAVWFSVVVTNTSASAVTLQNLVVTAGAPAQSLTIAQPILVTNNLPIGVGNPVLTGSTGSFTAPFSVVFDTPNTPGKAPQTPGGAAGASPAVADNAVQTLNVTAQASDGSISTGSIQVPVLSAVSPFPVPEGGALIFKQGRNAALGAVAVF